MRQAGLDQIGLLDDRYFMYTEEVDLCYRLAQAGWGLWYVPTAVVTHFGEASSRQMAERMYVQLHRSKVQFYRKFGGKGRARQAKDAVYTGLRAPSGHRLHDVPGSTGFAVASVAPTADCWRSCRECEAIPVRLIRTLSTVVSELP